MSTILVHTLASMIEKTLVSQSLIVRRNGNERSGNIVHDSILFVKNTRPVTLLPLFG